MKVKFIDVGRNKRSWDADLKPIDTEIVRHIKKAGVLMSRDIEVDLESGAIFAGMRLVGRFELEPFTL